MSTVGGKGGSHCPGMFISSTPPPSFRVGLCSAMPQKQPLPPLGGSAEEIFIHTYTHAQTGIILKRSQVDCSLKAQRVGGSGAATARVLDLKSRLLGWALWEGWSQ